MHGRIVHPAPGYGGPDTDDEAAGMRPLQQQFATANRSQTRRSGH